MIPFPFCFLQELFTFLRHEVSIRTPKLTIVRPFLERLANYLYVRSRTFGKELSFLPPTSTISLYYCFIRSTLPYFKLFESRTSISCLSNEATVSFLKSNTQSPKFSAALSVAFVVTPDIFRGSLTS